MSADSDDDAPVPADRRETDAGVPRETDAGDRRETDADGREPVTRRVHETSWSANLEGPHHADDRSLVIAEAIDAIAATASGRHVNLVTHADHGHPETYLWSALERAFEDTPDRLEWEYVDQCGCGGYVTRVHVE